MPPVLLPHHSMSLPIQAAQHTFSPLPPLSATSGQLLTWLPSICHPALSCILHTKLNWISWASLQWCIMDTSFHNLLPSHCYQLASFAMLVTMWPSLPALSLSATTMLFPAGPAHTCHQTLGVGHPPTPPAVHKCCPWQCHSHRTHCLCPCFPIQSCCPIHIERGSPAGSCL